MRILQISVSDTFQDTIASWAEEIPSENHSAIFHIYVPYDMEDGPKRMEEVRSILRQTFPDIPLVGCSATGEIIDGRMSHTEIVVSLMVFELPTTEVKVMTYYDLQEKMDPKALLDYCNSLPHLQGVEILTAAEYDRLAFTGGMLDRLPEEIEIFGAVAVGDDVHGSYVFADNHPISADGSVFIFYCGEDLHLASSRMFGWKAIGYPLEVTRSEDNVVYELDHKSAYDVYNHYLHIEKGSNFFYEALEFPWEVQVDEETGGYIRHAKTVNPDGSIVMSSNIPQGSKVRIAYGDPRRMVEHTIRAAEEVQKFGPQALLVVNCMGRMLFWGDRSGEEVSALSKYVPVTGFSALGEIMRNNAVTFLNNLSLVAIAMREGPICEIPSVDFEEMVRQKSMPITARLAIFINTITAELMEKNQQLNDMLFQANHDFLTKLLNRGAIERLIYEAKTNEAIGAEEDWFLIMFDVDDFKLINDTYGHGEGDQVLCDLAKNLIPKVKDNPRLDVGRWGGEEFMVFGYGYTDEEIRRIAELIRMQAKDPQIMHRPITVSIGVTKHQPKEPEGAVIDRVDEFLYQAKNEGKDCICGDL